MSVSIQRWGRASAAHSIAVVLSTYNQPEWLYKVLLGYARQTYSDFELVLADDGSDERTRTVVELLAPTLPMPLTHVWHPDDGFRKCVILNRAIEASRADYMVFSDGDCIPREDFIAVHAALRKPGRFLSGGYCKLPMTTSQRIDQDCIARGEFCNPSWLADNGCDDGGISRKLRVHGLWARVWDVLSTAKASWNGHNASGWRDDIISVNGFDERMQYGGEDREFGERLVNSGIRGIRVRHRAVVVHLDHARAYATAESIARNRVIRSETRRHRAAWAVNGLQPGPAPGAFGPPLIADH